jgi:hypothetical protein
MPIIRAAQTSNFTVISNAIANDETLSGAATAALIYLISKPPHWQFNAKDLKRRLGIGLNKVYRIMRELIAAGYASYQRIQSGTIWNIYDAKQNQEPATAPAVPDRVNFDCNQNECLLERIDLVEINTTTPAAPTPPIPAPITAVEVVVSDNELIYPVQLTPVQKKAARAVIKKVKQPEMQQEVLFALAYAITSGSVKSPVAYLNGLVTRANNGTFEPVTATTASKQGGRPLIPIWQGFGQSSPSTPETATGFIQQARAALRGAKC